MNSEFDGLARAARAEIERGAPALAKRLLPRPPGMTRLPRSAFLTMVREQWQEPAYRQQLLGKVGPKHFLDIAREAWGITKEQYEAAKMGPARFAVGFDGSGSPLVEVA